MAVKYICNAHHIESVRPGVCPLCKQALQKVDI